MRFPRFPSTSLSPLFPFISTPPPPLLLIPFYLDLQEREGQLRGRPILLHIAAVFNPGVHPTPFHNAAVPLFSLQNQFPQIRDLDRCQSVSHNLNLTFAPRPLPSSSLPMIDFTSPHEQSLQLVSPSSKFFGRHHFISVVAEGGTELAPSSTNDSYASVATGILAAAGPLLSLPYTSHPYLREVPSAASMTSGLTPMLTSALSLTPLLTSSLRMSINSVQLLDIRSLCGSFCNYIYQRLLKILEMRKKRVLQVGR